MRNLLLSLVYFVLVVPAGLISRVVRDPLSRRPDPAADTYWVTVTGGPASRQAALR
ncbi:hypothetical protein [Streptomyces sp. MMG1121]|uniref:hypothetical protein n=1 Tax=Streptomyces sp. MMG1121 TaxID=1415544 RepID=UPI000A4146A0|nr:hypothetical protein [Streptomyces sp. MMG1121]